MGPHNRGKVAPLCKYFMIAGFSFLLFVNATVMIITSTRPLPLLRHNHACSSMASVPQQLGDIPPNSYIYLGGVERTFFADLLREYNHTVYDDHQKYSLLEETRLPYSQKFIYVKEFGRENITQAGVSMIHQLHCLGAIRHTMEVWLDGDDWESDFEKFGIDMKFVRDHLNHCLDYVAQVSNGALSHPAQTRY